MDSMAHVVLGYGLTWGGLFWYYWRLERRWRVAREALGSVNDAAAEPMGGGR